jgi:hypothetical protein
MLEEQWWGLAILVSQNAGVGCLGRTSGEVLIYCTPTVINSDFYATLISANSDADLAESADFVETSCRT